MEEVSSLNQSQIQQFVEEAYIKYKSILILEVLKLTKDYSLAEDCVQDAFLVLNRRMLMGEFENINLKAFLSSVSHNIALKYISSNSRELAAGDYIDLIKFNEAECDSGEILFLENHEYIINAIKALAPIERRVLVLRYVNGLKYEDISKALNLNINSVKYLLNKSVKILKKNEERSNVL